MLMWCACDAHVMCMWCSCDVHVMFMWCSYVMWSMRVHTSHRFVHVCTSWTHMCINTHTHNTNTPHHRARSHPTHRARTNRARSHPTTSSACPFSSFTFKDWCAITAFRNRTTTKRSSITRQQRYALATAATAAFQVLMSSSPDPPNGNQNSCKSDWSWSRPLHTSLLHHKVP